MRHRSVTEPPRDHVESWEDPQNRSTLRLNNLQHTSSRVQNGGVLLFGSSALGNNEVSGPCGPYRPAWTVLVTGLTILVKGLALQTISLVRTSV